MNNPSQRPPRPSFPSGPANPNLNPTPRPDLRPDPEVAAPDPAAEMTFFVQLRLADALPPGGVEEWRAEIEADQGTDGPDEAEVRRQLARRIEQELNAGRGACWLRQPEIAGMVADCLKAFDGQRYQLRAWAIVPNRLHAVVTVPSGVDIMPLVRQWRNFTSREAAQKLGINPDEFWDRLAFARPCRDAKDLMYRIRAAEFLPVNAGLCVRPREWRWSSAYQASTPGNPAQSARPAPPTSAAQVVPQPRRPSPPPRG